MTTAATDRWLSLGNGLPEIPERLLLAHGRGEVLFLSGAGVSKSAGLLDFRELVLRSYQALDAKVHEALVQLECFDCRPWGPCVCETPDCSDLTEVQTAEVRCFILREYDVVLGMLVRWSYVVGQSEGKVKVDSEWL